MKNNQGRAIERTSNGFRMSEYMQAYGKNSLLLSPGPNAPINGSVAIWVTWFTHLMLQ